MQAPACKNQAWIGSLSKMSLSEGWQSAECRSTPAFGYGGCDLITKRNIGNK
jgi:hypothetical protein